MARAGAASASARPDSIQGLAQSIAKPAYRRLLTAEPLLRRAVPVLIIAFLATICVGAAVQVLDHRRQALNDMMVALDAVAEIAAERLRKAIQIHTRTLPGENLEVTVSIGVAGASLAMSGFEVLLKRADEALYEAKRTGRNRVVRAPKQVIETIHLAAE